MIVRARRLLPLKPASLSDASSCLCQWASAPLRAQTPSNRWWAKWLGPSGTCGFEAAVAEAFPAPPPKAHTPDTLWARVDTRQPKYACVGQLTQGMSVRLPTSTPHCDHEIAATGWHVPHGFPPCAASAPTPSHLKPPTVKCAHALHFPRKKQRRRQIVWRDRQRWPSQ